MASMPDDYEPAADTAVVLAAGRWCTVCEFFEWADDEEQLEGGGCRECGCDPTTHTRAKVVRA